MIIHQITQINNTLPYKSYLATKENYKEVLDKYGVCVIPNILTEYECIAYRNCLWNDINFLTKKRFNIDDINSWYNFYDLFPIHSMLIQHFSIAHSQTVWNIRQHEEIGKIFADIWSVPKEELFSSYDGISISLPPEHTYRGWYRGTEWLHTDQSPLKKGFNCIQGLVNLYPVNDGDSTLSVLEGSHKYHSDFFDSINNKDKNDWYKLEPNEKKFFINKGCNQYCVSAPIGSLVLWDSRTIHQGIEAQSTRSNENFRMAIYTCLTPKYKFSNNDIKRRDIAFQTLRLTNHWGKKIFPKYPRTYGKPIKEFNKFVTPILTTYGHSLK